MDLLSINQQVYIRRSDGRIHLGCIIKLDGGTNNTITVEWFEDSVIRGKEVPLADIVELNPHLFWKSSNQRHEDGSTFSPTSCYNNRNNATVQQVQPHRPTLTDRQPPNRVNLQRLLAGGIASAASRRPALRIVSASPRQLGGNAFSNRVDVATREVERLRENRERRRRMQAIAREERERLRDDDNPNWEISRLIELHRRQMEFSPITGTSGPLKEHQITVCVRKRPLNPREVACRELDVISVPSPELLVVHEPRRHVNLTKFLENHNYRFDYSFDEYCSNATVYEYTARPLIKHIFDGGMATCFAYGQTGAGKTHTMGGHFTGRVQNFRDGIYALAAEDVFTYLHTMHYNRFQLKVSCSFFEIYGSRVYDLLMPGKPQLRVLEDGNQQVQVVGLVEKPVQNPDDVLRLIELGNSVRTSGQTSANNVSSRSHAVFQIILRAYDEQRLHGKFSLIDLAGNERGADNSSSDRHTRIEGSEINKSLLALKECIRALGMQLKHLPFRGSKLTQVLRDSFIGGKRVKTCMIAMISPGLNSCEHTLNTLRYADRVKELSSTSPPKSSIPTQRHTSRTSELPTTSFQAAAASLETSTVHEDSNVHRSNWNSQTLNNMRDGNNLSYFNAMTQTLVDEPQQMVEPKVNERPADSASVKSQNTNTLRPISPATNISWCPEPLRNSEGLSPQYLPNLC